MNTNNIKFRVRNGREIIGYETFDIHFGWRHIILAEKDIYSDDDNLPLHSGIINDTEYTFDYLIREQYTEISDQNKNDLYDNDELINDKGEKFKIVWNRNQSGWWIERTNPQDIIDYISEPLTNGMIYMSTNTRLGDGYFSRKDLTVAK
jgi:hypothetical protein